MDYALVDEADVELVSQYRWSFDQDGYVVASPRRGVKLRLHRLLLGLEKGDGLEGDHRNGDRRDNTRGNLRAATRAQNGQNVPSKPGSSSRYRGVGFEPSEGRTQPWRARATLAGVKHHIGWFADEDEAGAAVAAWRAKHMPFAEESRNVARAAGA